MGHEHDINELECGCIHHYTYREACDMGPINGTEKKWAELCQLHREYKSQKDSIRSKYSGIAQLEIEELDAKFPKDLKDFVKERTTRLQEAQEKLREAQENLNRLRDRN